MLPRLSARRTRKSVPFAWLTGLLLAGLAYGPARADYRLAPGDVIEVSAMGLPDLHQRVAIDLDGNVGLPAFGQVKAAGRTLADLRKELGKSIATKDFRVLTNDGKVVHLAVGEQEFNLTIAEYRPVFVNGDVANPGAQGYRVNLTVRQAVASAGGYDLLHMKLDNPFVMAVDARSDVESIATDLTQERITLARLQAELADKTDFDPGKAQKTSFGDSVAVIEKLKLTERRTDADSQRAYLRDVMESVGSKLTTLTDQTAKEKEGAKLDTDEYDRVRKLLDQGLVPITRVTEARRLSLLSSTGALETDAQAQQAKRDREDFERQLVAFNSQRRLEILNSIQESTAKIAGLEQRLVGARQKLAVAAAMKSQLGQGKVGEKTIVVVRKVDGEAQQITATEDTELQPGDVVEITFRLAAAVELSGE